MKKTCGKYVLYGFRKDDIDDVGYLSMTGSGYEITKEISSAMRFDRPEWESFMNTEDELSAWKFHKVAYNM